MRIFTKDSLMAVFYDKKRSKWKAEIWFNGRRYMTKSFSKKTVADKFHREKLLDLELGLLKGSRNKEYFYNELYEFWHQNASKRKRPTSLAKDHQMHRDYVSPCLGKLRVSEITQLNFEQIVDVMLNKGLSRASINKVIQHFKAVFNHAFNNEFISRNPARSFKQLRIIHKEMDYFSQDEMDTLLSYTDKKYVGANRWKHVLYLTLFLTGKRLGEVLGLEWKQVSLDRNLISVNQMWCALENKVIFTTKGRKDRLVPLNSILKAELGAIKNLSNSSFVFSNVPDRPFDPSLFRQRHWSKDLKACGIRPMRIHDARHTYASLFMMNGGNLYELKEILGHSSIKTTERYAHLSNSHLASVRDIIKPNINNECDVVQLMQSNQKFQPEIMSSLVKVLN